MHIEIWGEAGQGSDAEPFTFEELSALLDSFLKSIDYSHNGIMVTGEVSE